MKVSATSQYRTRQVHDVRASGAGLHASPRIPLTGLRVPDRSWVRDALSRRRRVGPQLAAPSRDKQLLDRLVALAGRSDNTFDLPTAVLLAKCAFEAYSEPSGPGAFTEKGLQGDAVHYMDREYLAKNFEGILRVNVRRGKGLIAADPWGKSDPYVTLTVGLSGAQTSVKFLTLDPEWNETLLLYVRARDQQRLTIKVMDKDQLTNDDLIGTAVLPLAPLCERPPVKLEFNPAKMLAGFLGNLFKGKDDDKDLKTVTVPLEGPKGENGGTLEIGVAFYPFKDELKQDAKEDHSVTSLEFADAWGELASTVHEGFAVPPSYSPLAFIENTESDTQCWVFKDKARKEIIFSFRGTEQVKWKDLATDASLMPTRMDPETVVFDPNAGGLLKGITDVARFIDTAKGQLFKSEDTMSVHSGFLAAYYSVKPRLMNVLDGALDSGEWTVLITGHSLGGALSTLFAFEVANRTYIGRHKPKHISLYNYGSPRVGNNAFAKKFKELVPDSWRVHNVDDVVPMVPRLLGYRHVDTSVTLTPEGTLVIDDQEVNGGAKLFEGKELDDLLPELSQEIVKKVREHPVWETLPIDIKEKAFDQIEDLKSTVVKAEQASDYVKAAKDLSSEKKQALLDRIWEQELLVLNKLLDGKALQDHLEGNYLKALTLAFAAGAAAAVGKKT